MRRSTGLLTGLPAHQSTDRPIALKQICGCCHQNVPCTAILARKRSFFSAYWSNDTSFAVICMHCSRNKAKHQDYKYLFVALAWRFACHVFSTAIPAADEGRVISRACCKIRSTQDLESAPKPDFTSHTSAQSPPHDFIHHLPNSIHTFIYLAMSNPKQQKPYNPPPQARAFPPTSPPPSINHSSTISALYASL